MQIISDEITSNGTYIIRNVNFEHGYMSDSMNNLEDI